MMSWRAVGALAFCAATAACSNTIGGGARSETSGYDGSTQVWISPHGTNCGARLICTSVGAEWNARTPDKAVLVVTFDGDYVGIRGVSLRVDGTEIPLQGGSDVTNFSNATGVMRESQRTFPVSLALVRKIASSQRTWVQVTTSSGIIESALIGDGKDSKAIYAMRRFLAEVDRAQGDAPVAR